MKKNSQIFMMDMIFSFFVIIISLGIVFSYYLNSKDNLDIYALNSHLINSFTTTNINSLNDQVSEFFRQRKIKNIQNSVAQQVSEFYFLSEYGDAENLTKIFLSSYIQKQLNFNISLYNGSEYFNLYYIENKKGLTFEESSVSSFISRVIYGFVNSTNYYGPYVIEVRIWQ